MESRFIPVITKIDGYHESTIKKGLNYLSIHGSDKKIPFSIRASIVDQTMHSFRALGLYPTPEQEKILCEVSL